MPVIRHREIYYTPEDNVKPILDSLPDRAKTSLDVQIYALTDLALVHNLISAAQRGVRVRVMNDRSQSAGKANRLALQMLVDAGELLPPGRILVKIVESEKGAISHLKQMVIDGGDGAAADNCMVLTGSYNFSDGAQNQDNVLIIDNDPGACLYAITKFNDDWQHNKTAPEWQILPTTAPKVG